MWPFKDLHPRTREAWFRFSAARAIQHHLVVTDTPSGGLHVFLDGAALDVLTTQTYTGVLEPDVIAKHAKRGRAGAL